MGLQAARPTGRLYFNVSSSSSFLVFLPFLRIFKKSIILYISSNCHTSLSCFFSSLTHSYPSLSRLVASCSRTGWLPYFWVSKRSKSPLSTAPAWCPSLNGSTSRPGITTSSLSRLFSTSPHKSCSAPSPRLLPPVKAFLSHFSQEKWLRLKQR